MTITVDVFNTFRQEIDEYNDRRERLIKSSRDITNLSKKIIFLLHRVLLEDPPAGSELSPEALAYQKSLSKLKEVQAVFLKSKDDLKGDLFWRHERQVSPGLQEYIEALSFAHYLQYASLVTFEQVQATLIDPSDGKPVFPLTVADYALGISDLTGELMRYAISGITRSGGRERSLAICQFVRTCKADLENLTPFVHDLAKKQAVTSQSLQKIEDAAYALVLRDLEYEQPPPNSESGKTHHNAFDLSLQSDSVRPEDAQRSSLKRKSEFDEENRSSPSNEPR